MTRVFVSYRREDSRADAGRICDHLNRELGTGNVFMDIDDIEAGEHFLSRLKDTLNQCQVTLAIIGPKWASTTDEQGRPRLWEPDDFVHLEIQTALQRGIAIIPVLVDGATMPSSAQMPPDIGGLAMRQAISISDERFHEDAGRLVAAIERLSSRRQRRPSARWAIPLLAISGLGWWLWRAPVETQSTSPTKTTVETIELRTQGRSVTAEAATALVIQRGYFHQHWNSGAQPVAQFKTLVENEIVSVIDVRTNLQWQHSGSGKTLHLAGAQAWIRSLNQQRHGGFDDWRLPTLDEAMSLMSRETANNAHMDTRFAVAHAPFIWTIDRVDQERGWVVYYFDGVCQPERKDFFAYARAVRTRL